MALLEHDEGGDDLAAQLIRAAGHAGLRYGRMLQARRFDLDRADAMSRNVEDLVRAAGEPDIPVFIDVRGVSGVVNARKPFPVVARVPLGLAPEGRRQTRKRALEDHDAFLAGPA